MKYIRSYNESNSEGLNEQDILDFCEINLAYLMDDGLKIFVSPDYFDLKIVDYKVTLSFRVYANKRWGHIKDHVIQFLTHLKNEYDLVAEFGENIKIDMIGSATTYPDWFNINDIISEKIVPASRLKDNYKISKIQFKIKGEKV